MTLKQWLIEYKFDSYYNSENDWLKAFDEFKRKLAIFWKENPKEKID
jgi:hypothetical protein